VFLFHFVEKSTPIPVQSRLSTLSVYSFINDRKRVVERRLTTLVSVFVKKAIPHEAGPPVLSFHWLVLWFGENGWWGTINRGRMLSVESVYAYSM